MPVTNHQRQACAPTALADLDRIIDLYAYEQAPQGHLAGTTTGGGAGAYCYYGAPTLAHLAGTEIASWVDGLLAHISRTNPSAEDFRVEFDGRAWRVCRDVSGDVGTQLNIRRLAPTTPLLAELRLGVPLVRELLLAPWLNDGGLVVFAGLNGQGKTTLAASTVRSRLERYGGRAITVEDVLEHPLEGTWGPGSCRQIQVNYDTVSRQSGFTGAVRRAYRSMPATRPAILYVGEVRDVETAEEVVKAASNGMLVITTAHASDAGAAIERIATLSQATMGDAARSALAHALRLVVHQSLTLSPEKTGWDRGAFQQQILFSDGPAHPTANNIRRGEFAMMGQVQRFQQTRLANASRRGAGAAELLRELGQAAGH